MKRNVIWTFACLIILPIFCTEPPNKRIKLEQENTLSNDHQSSKDKRNPFLYIMNQPDLIKRISDFLTVPDYGRLCLVNHACNCSLKADAIKCRWIAKKLISDVYNPMGHILRLAQGNRMVRVYNQTVNSCKLLNELKTQGEKITQVVDPEKINHGCGRNKGEDAYIPVAGFTIRDSYDSCKWVCINIQDEFNYKEIEEKIIQTLHEHQNNCGIALYFEDIHISDAKSQDLFNRLAQYPIVSLSLQQSSLYDIECLAAFKELRELYVRLSVEGDDNPQMIKWPCSLCEFPHLQSLMIHDAILPNEIDNLQELRFLSINGDDGRPDDQKYEILPSTIENIPCLRKLSVRNLFNTTALTNSIAGLTNLSELDLSQPSFVKGTDGDERGSLTKLPDNLGNLKKLVKFNVAAQQFTTLPVSLKNCTNLEDLDFSGNPLNELPNYICLFERLKSFSATDCKPDCRISFQLLDFLSKLEHSNLICSDNREPQLFNNIIALRTEFINKTPLAQKLVTNLEQIKKLNQCSTDTTLSEPIKAADLAFQQYVGFLSKQSITFRDLNFLEKNCIWMLTLIVQAEIETLSEECTQHTANLPIIARSIQLLIKEKQWDKIATIIDQLKNIYKQTHDTSLQQNLTHLINTPVNAEGEILIHRAARKSLTHPIYVELVHNLKELGALAPVETLVMVLDHSSNPIFQKLYDTLLMS